MKITSCIVPALAAALLASSAYAQGGPAGQMNPSRRLPDTSAMPQPPSGTLQSNNDRKFLQQAAQGADYELAIAKLAEQKATRENIKAYSKDVVDAHEQLNSSLHQLAQDKGIKLPKTMTKQQQAQLSHLKSLNGTAFDQAYEKETIRINREDKKDLHREAASTKDEDIKDFVEKMQSVDAKHEEMAKTLQGKS